METKKSPLAEKILKDITEGSIRPRERSYFIKKRILTWMKVFLACFLGGHSLGILIYFFSDFDFNLLPLFLKTPEKKYLLLAIVIWFVFFIGGAIATYHQYRKTNRGYKTENLKLIFFILIGVVLIGNLSYKGEFSKFFDEKFSEHIPYYQSWESVKLSLWSRPESGFLAGRISEISNGKVVSITDLSGKKRTIDSGKAMVRNRVVLVKGVLIKLLGKLEGEVFIVKEVRPWKGRGRCRNAPDKEKCLRSSHKENY